MWTEIAQKSKKTNDFILYCSVKERYDLKSRLLK